MREFRIGGFTLVLEGTDTGYAIRPPVRGLEAPEYRENMYDRPGAPGAVLTSLLAAARLITVPGHIRPAASSAAYEARRRALAAACAPDYDAFGQPQLKQVAFTTPGGNSYFVRAFLRKPVMDYDHPTTADFLLNIVVPDGVLYGAAQIVSGAISRPSGGGFRLPVQLPIASSATTGGVVTVTNPGDEATAPVLVLTGPLTNPYVSNAATGQYLQLNYTIGGGDSVIVDMAATTILLNGTSSLLSTKAPGSSWWKLQPGSNAITLTTTSNSDTGSAALTAYPAYAGA